MTEQQLRNRVVTAAKSWLGWGESTGKHREIIDTYNRITPLPVGYKVQYTDDWCAAFVSAVGWKAGLSDIVLPECSCPRMLELYRKAGRWMERDNYVPSPGDLVLYHWRDGADYAAGDCTGSPNHVGIVVGVKGNVIRVIEGNMADKVGWRSLQANGRYIRGYCLPDYRSRGEEDEEMTEEQFDKMMARWLERQGKKKPEAQWQKEGLARAKEAGVTDGSNPMALCTRLEAAIMAANAKK